ncbi:flagellin N-terminal helical domain-containing protein [Paludibacterium paludis]|uniref:Flagellin n=1 Tax=Paludibacterium paludis TaxID=1225769 RepID=A0A918U787_9NEIS|nr:flagellin [Paludibacterium paludis]GGY04473.1 lateral flagellin [Paludibacterium paludis]
MLSLQTNVAALNTQRNMNATQNSLTTSMTRLGTGFRINSAADDAAGLQIATRMEAQTRGMTVAMKNTQNGISLMQTAEGALSEVSNIVLRMKDLATESASGAANDDDRKAMQAEYDALGSELNNIVKNTAFAGQVLLDKANGKLKGTVDFQIGASQGEKLTVDVSAAIGNLDKALKDITAKFADAPATPPAPPPAPAPASSLGTEIVKASDANGKLATLNTAIDTIGSLRAALGAYSNRMEHTYNNLSNMTTNTTVARSRIMDTDYASETANQTSKQMLMQAGTAMLKQSGSMNQLVMSLMQ